MFSDELEQIDRALSVDGGFSRFLRSRHANGIDPFRAERLKKNPNDHQRNSTAALNPATGKPWWEHKRK